MYFELFNMVRLVSLEQAYNIAIKVGMHTQFENLKLPNLISAVCYLYGAHPFQISIIILDFNLFNFHQNFMFSF